MGRAPEIVCQVTLLKLAAVVGDWISALWKFDFFFDLCLRVVNFDPEHRKTLL
jgi:hypothetical protein